MIRKWDFLEGALNKVRGAGFSSRLFTWCRTPFYGP